MALKWGNVTGASTNAGSSSLRDAGSLFGKAFDAFEGIAREKQTNLKSTNTALALDELRQLSTVEDFDVAEGGLSTEALNQRFGAGNFDAAAVSKLRDTARQGIVDQSRADTEYTQRQTDRNLRLSDAETSRERATTKFTRDTNTFNRLEAERLDENKAFELANQVDVDQSQLAASNTAGFQSAKDDLYRDDFFARQNDFVKIDDNGKVTFTPNTPEGTKKRYFALADKHGVKEFTSFNQQLKQLRDSATGPKGEPLVSARNLAKAEATLRNRANFAQLSTREQEEVTAAQTQGLAAQTRELKASKAEYDAALDKVKPNQTRSAEENADEYNQLSDLMAQRYPDDVLFNPTLFGGDNLQEEVAEMVNVGLEVNNKLVKIEPWMIKKHLTGATYNLTGGDFTDTSVNLNDLKEAIIRDVLEGSDGKAEDFLDLRRTAYFKQQEEITNKHSAAFSKFKTKYYRDRGITDTKRNLENLRSMARGQ